MYMQKDKSKIAGSITLVAGLWLMLAAFMMNLGLTSNVFIVGLLVLIFSLIELSSMESAKMVSWANGILGLWLLVSPLVFVTMVSMEMWNNIVLGAIMLGVAIWGGMSSKVGMGHPKLG